jgi:sigma-B regulation protein RsbU (phosphoserine phosphatase)
MESQRVKILLVEDDADDVWILRNLLGDRWDGPFDLIQVESLQTALAHCRRTPIDVMLLDLSLPDSQGLETFLTAYANVGEVPIVVLTGLDDERTAIKAVQTGAQDYLVKGRVDDNLLVRSVRYAIERNRRDQAERALRATSEEFRIAQQIQRRLFPSVPPSVAGFEIAGAVFPAKATSGDYFDFIPMIGGAVGIVIGDVSSHGMGPALVMAETRACLRALAEVHSDVGEILTRANRHLSREAEELHFVTLTLAKFQPGVHQVTVASAGQRGYVLDTDGECRILDSTSPPLGISGDMTVPADPPVALAPGQVIVFFTDGVVETESHGRARYGVPRALRLVASERHRPAKEIIEALYQSVCDFRGSRPQMDDITVVAIKVLPLPHA